MTLVSSVMPSLLGDRPVEFGDVGDDGAHIDIGKGARGAPASARAIISSALKVRISLSLSEIVVSSA